MKNLTTLLIAFLLCMLLTAATASAQRWTYPGEIHSHLASGHGVNANGMTTEQAERLHDKLHNQQAGNSVRQATNIRRTPFVRQTGRLARGLLSFRRR